MLIWGINTVIEALRAGRVTTIRVASRADGRVGALLEAAKGAGVAVERVAPADLDRASRGGVHQGVVAEVRASAEVGVEDLVGQAEGAALLVVLDGIEDPHNLGAILRTVDAAGGHGLGRPSRRAGPPGGGAPQRVAGGGAPRQNPRGGQI